MPRSGPPVSGSFSRASMRRNVSSSHGGAGARPASTERFRHWSDTRTRVPEIASVTSPRASAVAAQYLVTSSWNASTESYPTRRAWFASLSVSVISRPAPSSRVARCT